jgi:hypothetical protein
VTTHHTKYSQYTTVLTDGKLCRINSTELVPGDVVYVTVVCFKNKIHQIVFEIDLNVEETHSFETLNVLFHTHIRSSLSLSLSLLEGDKVPADIRVVESQDNFEVDNSSLLMMTETKNNNESQPQTAEKVSYFQSL